MCGYLREKIRDYVVGQYGDRIEASFVTQEPRRGLAHALWMTRDEIIREDEVLIVLGDTIFIEEVKEIMGMPGTMLGVKEVADPREYGIAVVDKEMKVIKAEEKPAIPTSNLALVGLYKIDNIKLFVSSLDIIVSREIPHSRNISLRMPCLGYD
ncbi:MAG: sugar phosphate nucleotidyltransferase [Bacteroidia bacterium]